MRLYCIMITTTVTIGCSDNFVSSLDPSIPESPTGALMVSPPSVDGVVCESLTTDIVLSNTGDGTLEITSLQTTGEWSVSVDALPQKLAEGEELTVTVDGYGDGTLQVISSDGDFEVPLSAAVESEPSVSWITPAEDGAILSDTDLTELQVEVSNATELLWSSDIEGDLQTTQVTDGVFSYTWDPLVHTNGPYMLTVAAKNECSKVISDRSVCQRESFTKDFFELGQWETSGDAYWDATAQELILDDHGLSGATEVFKHPVCK